MKKSTISILIKTIIALLVFTMLSVFVCGMVGVSIKNEKQKLPQVEAAETVYISNASGWESFREKVYDNDNKTNAVLTADIDFGGAKIWPIAPYADTSDYDYTAYSGTFDGQGHTLSNFTVEDSFNGACAVNGLFGNTKDAKISNLKVTNATYKAAGSNNSYIPLCIGGLVAVNWGNTSISKCYVDNVSLSTTSTGVDYINVGGILGVCYTGSPSVTDCYVKNLKINIPCYTQYQQGHQRVFVGGIHNNYDKDVSITRCIFDKTGFELTVTVTRNPDGAEIKRMQYNNGTVTGNDGSIGNYSRAYFVFQFVGSNATESYSSGVTMLGRYWSSVSSSKGGAEAADSYGKVYTWYFCTAYNNSLPVLRQFVVNWKDYLFTSTNSDVARISGNNLSVTITVPSDYLDSYVHVKSGDDSKFVVEGVNENIYVSIINDSYEFTGWSKYQNNVIANIELSANDLTFNLTDYFNETGLEVVQTFKISKQNNTINIEFSLSTIKIKFQDKDGISREINYTISNSAYCVDKIEIRDASNNLESTVTSNSSYTVDKGLNINVLAKLKTYGLELN